MKVDGKKVYKTTSNADIQKETGNVMSKVASDKNAIGYISLGSVNNTIKVVNVNGVAPSSETVLDGSYAIQRPFVIMTSSTIELTDIAEDFLLYLKSDASETHANEAGCIYLADETKRANEGETAIPVVEYEVKSSLPAGGKITVNGSTSMEKFIKKAMSGYATLYGRTADEIFTLDLQGSSVGKTAVQNDKNGNVIGLSSASVKEEGINSFNVSSHVRQQVRYIRIIIFENARIAARLLNGNVIPFFTCKRVLYAYFIGTTFRSVFLIFVSLLVARGIVRMLFEIATADI